MRFLFTQRPVLAGSALMVALTLVPVSAQQAPEKVDLDAVYKIKQEGFQNSKVMEIMSWLTDVYGPRLTNSPGFRKSGDWAVKEMTSWGLTNVKLEPFGPFGRGWSNDKFYMMATTPGGSFPVTGYPQAWTAGTNGVISGEAAYAVIETPEDITKFKGQLKGKIVLTQAMREVPAVWESPARRYTDAELRDIERETDASGRGGRGGRGGGRGGAGQTFAQTRMKFFKDEGVLALVAAGRGDGGTVFVQSGQGVGSRQPNEDLGLPSITIAIENYGRILRTLEKKMPVTIEMEIKNSFTDDTMSFNVVGEIAGTDKADELVMLGAHFDSWHGGTGATDNAAGSAVMMEAMRILKQSGLRLRRTVRIGLWGGEEQGLLGSRAYVTEHFANRADMVLKPAHAQVLQLLQRGQRDRRHPRRLPAGERSGRADLRGVDETLQQPRNDHADDSRYGRNGPPVVRCGGAAWLPVHPGSGRVQLAHASLQHGRVRADPGKRHEAERRDRGVVRVSRRQPGREAAAQAAAAAAGWWTRDLAQRRPIGRASGRRA